MSHEDHPYKTITLRKTPPIRISEVDHYPSPGWLERPLPRFLFGLRTQTAGKARARQAENIDSIRGTIFAPDGVIWWWAAVSLAMRADGVPTTPGLDPKVATGTPRTRTIGQRAVGFVQVVLWDLRFSGAGPAAGKVTLKETRVSARFLQTSWHNPTVEPAAIWERKWDAPSKSPHFKGFVVLPLFRERRSQKSPSPSPSKDSDTLLHLLYAWQDASGASGSTLRPHIEDLNNSSTGALYQSPQYHLASPLMEQEAYAELEGERKMRCWTARVLEENHGLTPETGGGEFLTGAWSGITKEKLTWYTNQFEMGPYQRSRTRESRRVGKQIETGRSR
ncbi:hypothetical protein BGY98DRAFT_1181540 [Russula aff. rugulosa BPL654]|nr:hypothetical protein BGY98DRAFT_1181540 [Russula aff. rugulosa BPL654]